MPDKSAAAMREAAKAVGTMQVMSHFGGEFDRNPDGSITGVDRIDGVITGQTNQYYRDFAQAIMARGLSRPYEEFMAPLPTVEDGLNNRTYAPTRWSPSMRRCRPFSLERNPNTPGPEICSTARVGESPSATTFAS